MSQISLKSISGITSITTPAGVDNQFTLHTNNTSQALKLDSAGNIHVHNHMNTTGVTTASNFKTGTSNVHNVGIEIAGINVLGADTPIGAGSTIYNSGAAVFTGVVTATSFSGSGANLTSLPAQATIANNADNRVITGGSGVNLNGESGLTYNGSTLALSGSLAMTGGSISLDSHSLIATAGFTDISGGSYAARLGSTGSSTIRSTQIYGGGNHIATFDGVNYRLGINETSPDGMLHLKGGVPSIFLEDTDGTHGQAIIEQNGDILKIRQDAGNASSGTGSVIQFEVDGSAWAKVDTAFGLKADNTCKAWLVYRSEAGNEGIIDDFNVATVNDETTGTFGVNLEVNVHRHGNGFSQSIVFGSYNASSYPFVASVGYAPSHGSNNPWWDVEDNFVRVQTQRSDTGAILDAKVFSLAMFGDTGDLNPA